ncbi:hypothetical protein L9F63_025182, partial [Diploptera punctata]
MDLIKQFVETNFPESYLKEERHCFVVFGVRTEMPLSKMFGLMEKAKKTIIFEDYSLGQSTLEERFIGPPIEMNVNMECQDSLYRHDRCSVVLKSYLFPN